MKRCQAGGRQQRLPARAQRDAPTALFPPPAAAAAAARGWRKAEDDACPLSITDLRCDCKLKKKKNQSKGKNHINKAVWAHLVPLVFRGPLYPSPVAAAAAYFGHLTVPVARLPAV